MGESKGESEEKMKGGKDLGKGLEKVQWWPCLVKRKTAGGGTWL